MNFPPRRAQTAGAPDIHAALSRGTPLETLETTGDSGLFLGLYFSVCLLVSLWHPAEKRGFLIKTSDTESRNQTTFHFLSCYNFPTTEAADYLSVGTWLNIGHPFRKPMLLNKTKAFLVFGLFESFSCSPLAYGREIARCCLFWFFSFIPQTWNIEV